MCEHGAGWALECPYPHPYPFKFAGNYPCPNPYPTMRVFTRPSWVFFCRCPLGLGPIVIPKCEEKLMSDTIDGTRQSDKKKNLN